MTDSAQSNQRLAGVVAPLFALRSESDLGIGDTATLHEFIDWAANAGVGIVQLLPVNETGADHSPYNAISSVALDPVYGAMSPGQVPGLSDAAFAEVCEAFNVDALRAAESVDYKAVVKLKNALLEAGHRGFREMGEPAEVAEFSEFCQLEQEWLEDYCLFRVLMDREGGNECWDHWNDRYNSVATARAFVDMMVVAETDEGRAMKSRIEFYAYVQWVLWRQFAAIRQYANERGVKLMGDIPFGVSYYSADVYCRPELFDLEWSGGAPPEKVFKDDEFVIKWGQNWGIPLYRWDVMKDKGYAWWRQRVAKTCAIFDLFRIDHVLGFFRIYSFPWRPQRNMEFMPLTLDEAKERTGGQLPHFVPLDDELETNREANCQRGMGYLRVVQEAADECGSEIIAEDLGTVPPYVRPALLEMDIPGTKVPQWEWTGDYFTPGSEYPECTLATYATHDHEPMIVMWQRLLREMNEGETHEERKIAGRTLYLLRVWAGMEILDTVPDYDDSVREGLLRGLCSSNSRHAVMMINDFLGTGERFNVPGVAGVQNWSQRLQMTVSDLSKDSHWADVTSRMREIFATTGRA